MCPACLALRSQYVVDHALMTRTQLNQATRLAADLACVGGVCLFGIALVWWWL